MVWRRMLVVLVWVGLATGQIKPAQQSLTRALELHQSGHYAEAIVAYQKRDRRYGGINQPAVAGR